MLWTVLKSTNYQGYLGHDPFQLTDLTVDDLVKLMLQENPNTTKEQIIQAIRLMQVGEHLVLQQQQIAYLLQLGN